MAKKSKQHPLPHASTSRIIELVESRQLAKLLKTLTELIDEGLEGRISLAAKNLGEEDRFLLEELSQTVASSEFVGKPVPTQLATLFMVPMSVFSPHPAFNTVLTKHATEQIEKQFVEAHMVAPGMTVRVFPNIFSAHALDALPLKSVKHLMLRAATTDQAFSSGIPPIHFSAEYQNDSPALQAIALVGVVVKSAHESCVTLSPPEGMAAWHSTVGAWISAVQQEISEALSATQDKLQICSPSSFFKGISMSAYSHGAQLGSFLIADALLRIQENPDQLSAQVCSEQNSSGAVEIKVRIFETDTDKLIDELPVMAGKFSSMSLRACKSGVMTALLDKIERVTCFG